MDAFVWALVTAGVWGIVPVMEKAGLAGTIPPTLGVMVRSLGVVVGLVCCSGLWLFNGAWRTVSGSSLVLLAGGGFLASFVGQLAFYQALKTGALSQVTPVAGAYPLVAALIGWVLLREPLTGPRLLGVGFVVLGVALLRR